MTPKAFKAAYLDHARRAEAITGIPAVFILAQAAFESAWGEKAPGNAFFGVKDTDGINGNEQLITTTEYHSTVNVKYPIVLSITPVIRSGRKVFKYSVKDYFRKYDTPEASFIDHGRFFLDNPRYAAALKVKADPYKFADAVAAAGYATDINYAATLKKVIKMIQG